MGPWGKGQTKQEQVVPTPLKSYALGTFCRRCEHSLHLQCSNGGNACDFMEPIPSCINSDDAIKSRDVQTYREVWYFLKRYHSPVEC